MAVAARGNAGAGGEIWAKLVDRTRAVLTDDVSNDKLTVKSEDAKSAIGEKLLALPRFFLNVLALAAVAFLLLCEKKSDHPRDWR